MLEYVGKVSRQVGMVFFVDEENRSKNAPLIRRIAHENRHILLVKAESQNHNYPGLPNFSLNIRFYVASGLFGVSSDILGDRE